MKVSEVEHLSELKVVLFDKTYILNPAEDLAASVSGLSEHLQTQPARYAFYASLRDTANHKVDLRESEYHRIRAQRDGEWRRDGELPSGGKPTEDGIRRALAEDADVAKAFQWLLKAKHEAALLQSIVRAFEQRRDVLIALVGRQNTGTFHDKDVKVEVAAEIRLKNTKAVVAPNAGRHPSKG